jgi:16S rRNA (cytidine1402-2'-O)-methyltransferase
MSGSKQPGTLFLIPANISEPIQAEAILPREVIDTVARLEYFIVEDAKSARRFLKAVGTAKPLQELKMRELNEHTPPGAVTELIQPLLQGMDAGLLSEAGAPAVADPGAHLIALAHRMRIPVAPLIGPSSLLLALMASGLNGQAFAFHGYLPANQEGRLRTLRELERESAHRDTTQMFIETPYRNNALLADIMSACNPHTRLCIACNLTAADQLLNTRQIGDWMADLPDLNRRPAVFLLLAPSKKVPHKR